MRITIIKRMHNAKVLIQRIKDLVLVSGWGSKISASEVLGSSDITSLTYSLSSLTWCTEFSLCCPKSSAELGICIKTQKQLKKIIKSQVAVLKSQNPSSSRIPSKKGKKNLEWFAVWRRTTKILKEVRKYNRKCWKLKVLS